MAFQTNVLKPVPRRTCGFPAEVMPLDLELPDRLAARLAAPLPGPAYQSQFAPELCYGRHQGPPAQDVRHAAVMVLLYPDDQRWRLPLTLRPDHLPNHGGQISFPGGQIESGESIEAAACRELHEELGIDGQGLCVMGRLSPVYVFGSNFLVTPCVAAMTSPPEFRPCANEVVDLLTPSLDELCDPQSRGAIKIERRGVGFKAPCIRHDQHCIWGATNMMLAEFLAVLQSVLS